jgi:putative ABC transport system ATP-binding protein
MRLLDELHSDGATICMVTHDPRFAECAKRRIAMFDGQVVDEEILEELRANEDLRAGVN